MQATKDIEEQTLTPKQEAFANCLAMGMSQADAYRAAYDCKNTKASSIHVSASKLAAEPKVKQRVEEYKAKQEQAMIHDGARLRDHVVSRLVSESTAQKSPATARIRALELLGKLDIVQVFRETKQQTEDKPPEELEKLIMDKLKALTQGQTMQ